VDDLPAPFPAAHPKPGTEVWLRVRFAQSTHLSDKRFGFGAAGSHSEPAFGPMNSARKVKDTCRILSGISRMLPNLLLFIDTCSGYKVFALASQRS
jgi:hypothetical protein